MSGDSLYLSEGIAQEIYVVRGTLSQGTIGEAFICIPGAIVRGLGCRSGDYDPPHTRTPCLPLVDELAYLPPVLVIAAYEAHRQSCACVIVCLDHSPAVFERPCHRLFAHGMFARSCGFDDRISMKLRRYSYDHRIYVIHLHECIIACTDARDFQLFSLRFGCLFVHVSQADDFRIRMLENCRYMRVADSTGSDHTETNFVHSFVPPEL